MLFFHDGTNSKPVKCLLGPVDGDDRAIADIPLVCIYYHFTMCIVVVYLFRMQEA